ncbi:hypothetical protein OF83DRAFT_1172349 [Amylostereum chailletii]|nr:hypothetical protein OF83DRAFT_1172349 [Amylostereum chailletii]
MPLCTCQKNCNGGTEVSKATYKHHAHDHISATFKTFLASGNSGSSSTHKCPRPSSPTSCNTKRAALPSRQTGAGLENVEESFAGGRETEGLEGPVFNEPMDDTLIVSTGVHGGERDDSIVLPPHPLDPDTLPSNAASLEPPAFPVSPASPPTDIQDIADIADIARAAEDCPAVSTCAVPKTPIDPQEDELQLAPEVQRPTAECQQWP